MNAKKDDLSILAFSGSLRQGSYNTRLLHHVGDLLGQRHRLQITTVDLKDFSLPIYDGDIEAERGLPEAASEFRDLMQPHRLLLIACPEYNRSIPGGLKNLIDWVSRPIPKAAPGIDFFRGKQAALMSTAGQFGGLMSCDHLRTVLSALGVSVLPTSLHIPYAAQVFAETAPAFSAAQRQAVDRFIETITATMITHASN